MRNPNSGLYEALVGGGDVASRFAAGAMVDTPLRGTQGADDWIIEERAWLAAGSAQVRPLNHIVTDTHASAEYVIAMTHEGSLVELPLHLVAELDGDKISVDVDGVRQSRPISHFA